MMGGRFYDQAEASVIIDPKAAPSAAQQNSLVEEMRRYDELQRLDMRYRDLAGGAGLKTPEAMWTIRNQTQAQMTEQVSRVPCACDACAPRCGRTPSAPP